MKYSIVISNIINDSYAVICKAWKLDQEGQEYDVRTLNKSNLTLEQAQLVADNFIKENK